MSTKIKLYCKDPKHPEKLFMCRFLGNLDLTSAYKIGWRPRHIMQKQFTVDIRDIAIEMKCPKLPEKPRASSVLVADAQRTLQSAVKEHNESATSAERLNPAGT